MISYDIEKFPAFSRDISLVALLRAKCMVMARFNATTDFDATEERQLYTELVGQSDCLLAVLAFAFVLMLIFVS